MELLNGWVGLILGFSALVFVHELGHFLLAKWNGVRVHVFSVGMGPYLISFTWHETLYVISMFPIGGYVKMMGQDDLNANPAASTEKSDYRNKRPGQRAAILAAGATFNLLFTIFLFTLCYHHGMSVDPARIGEIMPGKPLALATLADPPNKPANLQPGDRIREVDGVPIKSALEAHVQIAAASREKDLFLRVERQSSAGTENPVLIVVRPQLDKQNGTSTIGLEAYTPRETFALGFTTDDKVAVVDDPIKDQPAAEAGFQFGDELLSVEDAGRPEGPRGLLHPRDFVAAIVGSEGRPLKVQIRRKGTEQLLSVTPRKNEKTGNFMIGLAPTLMRQVSAIEPQSEAYKAGLRERDYVLDFIPNENKDDQAGQLIWTQHWTRKPEIKQAELHIPPTGSSPHTFITEVRLKESIKYDLKDAMQMAWEDTKRLSFNTLTVLKGLFTRDVSASALSGPAGIGHLIYTVANNASFVNYLWLIGYLSLSLGVLQFIPIPLLDGWHLLMILVEKLKGSPVAPKIQEAFQYVGLFLIGSLLLYATYNDILHWFR